MCKGKHYHSREKNKVRTNIRTTASGTEKTPRLCQAFGSYKGSGWGGTIMTGWEEVTGIMMLRAHRNE